MGRIDHQPSRFASLACQLREDLVEHAKTAPSHKPIVDGLVRPVTAWRIAPAQPVLDDEDDPADDPPVINPGNTMRQWERSGASAPRRAEINRPWRRLLAAPMNQSTN